MFQPDWTGPSIWACCHRQGEHKGRTSDQCHNQVGECYTANKRVPPNWWESVSRAGKTGVGSRLYAQAHSSGTKLWKVSLSVKRPHWKCACMHLAYEFKRVHFNQCLVHRWIGFWRLFWARCWYARVWYSPSVWPWRCDWQWCERWWS